MRYTSRYWNIIAPVFRHEIGKTHGYDVGKLAYEDGRGVYKELIEGAPELGEGNPMEATFLQAMVIVALWKAGAGQLSVEDMRQISGNVFSRKPLGAIKVFRDANRDPLVLNKILNDLHAAETWAHLHEGDFETAWRIDFDVEPHEVGITYAFTRCPIAEYCASLGIEEITPVLCDMDHFTTKLIGAKLEREHTLAEGAENCDYWIYPSEEIAPR